ncbi:hypothetical protein [Sphingobium sp. CR28]|uniref:hypothetical protein n=1 Tax=Sphingobium sp. CR28 TaxID=3400272 RepID=UPI003FF02A10
MYTYLDRPLGALTAKERFLLASMRAWVGAARGGGCLCEALVHAFRHNGMGPALDDFCLIMATLDSAAIGHLRFGSLDLARVTDDEARILALFEVARAGPLDRLRRVSAGLVQEDAVASLAQAVDFVAIAMADTDTDTGRS